MDDLMQCLNNYFCFDFKVYNSPRTQTKHFNFLCAIWFIIPPLLFWLLLSSYSLLHLELMWHCSAMGNQCGKNFSCYHNSIDLGTKTKYQIIEWIKTLKERKLMWFCMFNKLLVKMGVICEVERGLFIECT